jgi:lysozyme
MSNADTGEANGLNVVVDLSHHNANVDFLKVKQSGIAGIIHKATQGLTYTDPTYGDRKKQALGTGLMWGAYHFGTGGDPIGQANHFLETVQPGEKDLLVLDFEKNTGGTTMALKEAEDFVSYIHEKTGRWPGFYSGGDIKKALGNRADTILANCWFWLAQYGPQAEVPTAWKTWTMWQYTDGNIGPEPHSVNGIGNCDRDKFNGNMAALKKLWRY